MVSVLRNAYCSFQKDLSKNAFLYVLIKQTEMFLFTHFVNLKDAPPLIKQVIEAFTQYVL